MAHPPLKPGEKCPLAKDKTSDGKSIETDSFVQQIKLITVNKIKSKDIKDHKRLFGKIIVEVTKFLENYSE